MKRRITLSIALTLSIVLVLLTSSDPRVAAQNQIKIVADTGVVTLGPNQKLRLSVVSIDGELGGGIYGVRFRQTRYSTGVCSGGICQLTAATPTTSDVMPVAPGESLLFDMIDPQGQVVVLSSNRNVRVNASIIDTATGAVVAVYNPSTGFFF